MFRVSSKHHTTGRNKVTDHQSMNSFLDDFEQESEDPILAENEMYKATVRPLMTPHMNINIKIIRKA